ncbi:hypothetical protein IV203_036047 [Nitzschia inconspicua]|uniref:Uncharacterized protein n=1 Tax=Nitzschia inconspicua TaxID=303405 RepID=A0A9K3LG41_9STRA|nr:hypothetical protein IV203_036047 [Nitzschia inconspicua]
MHCDQALALECNHLECSLALDAYNALYHTLATDLAEKPPEFPYFPFHQYISHATSIMASVPLLSVHQHLGHPSDHYLYHAHEHFDPIFEKCLTCIQANRTKESAGTHSTRTATQPFKGLSVDFLFARIHSKNVARKKDFTGLNGETCRILLNDHFNRAVFGDIQVSRGPPLALLLSSPILSVAPRALP